MSEPDTVAPPPPGSRIQPSEPPLDCDTPLARAWAVALWVMAGVGLIWLALPAAAQVVQGLDDRAWETVVSAEQPVFVALARFLDAFGGTLLMSVTVVVVALLLAWRRHWPGLVVWLLAMTVSQGLNVLIKSLYERARPPLGLVEEHSFSFVSGHSLTAAVIAITLVLVWVPTGHRRRNLLMVAVAYATAMAASRVYLRAHWLTDAYVGVVIGAGVAVTVTLLASWWVARSER